MTMLDAMFGVGGLAVLSQNLWRAIQYEGINYVVGAIDLQAGVEPLGLKPAESDEGGSDQRQMLRVTVVKGSGGLTTPPLIDDRVYVDGATYQVREITAAGTHYLLLCQRSASHEVTRRGFRGSR